MHDGIYLSNISKELITEPFAFTCALYKAGYIYEFYGGRNCPVWLNQLGERGQSFIGYIYLTDIRLDGAKAIIGRLCLCAIAYRIKKC